MSLILLRTVNLRTAGSALYIEPRLVWTTLVVGATSRSKTTCKQKVPEVYWTGRGRVDPRSLPPISGIVLWGSNEGVVCVWRATSKLIKEIDLPALDQATPPWHSLLGEGSSILSLRSLDTNSTPTQVLTTPNTPRRCPNGPRAGPKITPTENPYPRP